MKMGDGFEEGTFLGPISHASQFERVKEFLASIEKDQLNIATGSTKPPDDAMSVVEEPFGMYIFPIYLRVNRLLTTNSP